jgi:cytochrome c551/c552
MFSFRNSWIAAAVMAVAGLAAAQDAGKFPGIGRTATVKEVAAWDIDVRPDFKGLPAGSGTVAKGQDVWEGKCAQCHGVFGDSNEFFSPLIGGTTADDIKTGHAAKLKDPTAGRTTLMKVATVSTLWDYINRAMPWTQPKSLSTEEVYAVTAFLLNLSGVVPDDFTLSDKNIAQVQARMPNRNGMTTLHAMWPGDEFKGAKVPDVKNIACMKNCAAEPKVASFLPDFARNAHGNLAEQNRPVGAQHGADTTRPEVEKGSRGAISAQAPATPKAAVVSLLVAAAPAGGIDSKAAQALTQKNSCTACHSIDKKLIGPSFLDIASKHAGKADYLAEKIRAGGSGVWGPIPMPAQSLAEADAKTIAAWLAAGAAK